MLTVVADSYAGWWLGLSISFLVVVVAVAVVGVILGVASQLSEQAATLSQAVDEAGAQALASRELEDANGTLRKILETTRSAGGRLGG